MVIGYVFPQSNNVMGQQKSNKVNKPAMSTRLGQSHFMLRQSGISLVLQTEAALPEYSYIT